MKEGMRDMGKAAMMAAAMNAGMSTEAKAGYKVELSENPTEQLSSTHACQVADKATQEFFKKIDRGEERLVVSSKPAEIVTGEQMIMHQIPGGGPHPSYGRMEIDLVAAMDSQHLRISADEGKIFVDTPNGPGDGLEWNIAVLDKKGSVVSQTEKVQLNAVGDWVEVHLSNSDGSYDRAVFAGGEIISLTHLDSMDEALKMIEKTDAQH